MAKTYTAQSVNTINGLHFDVDGDTVVGLKATVEVNYGAMGLTHQYDVWANLTPAERTKAQQVYDRVKALTIAYFIG